jgi:hypothetical protein
MCSSSGGLRARDRFGRNDRLGFDRFDVGAEMIDVKGRTGLGRSASR